MQLKSVASSLSLITMSAVARGRILGCQGGHRVATGQRRHVVEPPKGEGAACCQPEQLSRKRSGFNPRWNGVRATCCQPGRLLEVDRVLTLGRKLERQCVANLSNILEGEEVLTLDGVG